MNEVATIRHKECEEKRGRSIGNTDLLDAAIEYLRSIVGVGASISVVRSLSLYQMNM